MASAQPTHTCISITSFRSASTRSRRKGRCRRLPEVQQIATGNTRYKLEMGRGERLFGSRRYPDARTSFLRLRPHATSEEDAELVSLRLAEIEYFQGRYSNARESLRPFLTSGARQAEARFFYLMSQRGLRNDDMFIELVRALERDFPESTWTEEALNHLATFYIQRDRDDEADAVLREMYARFPRGRYAERAAWKAGWTSYRQGEMREAARLLRVCLRKLSTIGLPSCLAVLVGPRARCDGRYVRRTCALPADDRRLSQYLLRPPGGKASSQKQGASLGPSRLVFAPARVPLGGEDDDFPPTEGHDPHAACGRIV